MGNEPIVWIWRILPRWTMLDDIMSGMEPTEKSAQRAAETELWNHSKSIAALVYPVGLLSGEWVALAKPYTGLRTNGGKVRWLGTWNDGKSDVQQ